MIARGMNVFRNLLMMARWRFSLGVKGRYLRNFRFGLGGSRGLTISLRGITGLQLIFFPLQVGYSCRIFVNDAQWMRREGLVSYRKMVEELTVKPPINVFLPSKPVDIFLAGLDE